MPASLLGRIHPDCLGVVDKSLLRAYREAKM
jgi:hypothetical protein